MQPIGDAGLPIEATSWHLWALYIQGSLGQVWKIMNYIKSPTLRRCRNGVTELHCMVFEQVSISDTADTADTECWHLVSIESSIY